MTHPRRSACIAAVLAAVLAAAGAPSGAAAHPARATALPGAHAPSTERSLVDLLAGSPTYLVYIRTAQLAAGGHVVGSEINLPRTYLFVRTRSGSTRTLGHAPAGLQHTMSISGTMLTGVADQPDYGPVRAAYWWDLTSGRHGILRVPPGYHYEAAAPHGAVLSKGGRLFTVSTTGKIAGLGTPFAAAADQVVTSDATGLVVHARADGTHDTPLAYQSFAHPGKFVSLQSGTALGLVCPALDRSVVACAAEDSDGGVNAVSLVPVDGSAPTVVTAQPLSEQLAVHQASVMWSGSSGLRSFSGADPTVRTGPKRFTAIRYNRDIAGTDPYPDIRQFGVALLGAFGGAVEASRLAGSGVALATSVDHSKRLFGTPPSPAAVARFSLHDGRVAYTTDRQVGGRSASFSTFTARVVTAGGKARFADNSLLHRGSDYTLAGISKSTRVYAVRSGQEHADLFVNHAGRTHRIQHVPFDSYLQVSGHRVMYAPDRLIAGGATAVYDAATGKTTKIRTDAACCDQYQGTYGGRTPALSGDSVFFLAANGSVWRHVLATGHEARLSRPVTHASGGIVFASHRHVAWTVAAGGATKRYTSAFVDLAGEHQPHAVTRRIVGVSSVGVLTTTSDLADQAGAVGFSGSYTLHRFAGGSVTVLSSRNVVQVPQLDGRTIAWVSAAGRLHVKAVS